MLTVGRGHFQCLLQEKFLFWLSSYLIESICWSFAGYGLSCGVCQVDLHGWRVFARAFSIHTNICWPLWIQHFLLLAITCLGQRSIGLKNR